MFSTEQKAKIFDKLVEEFQGNHLFIGNMRRSQSINRNIYNFESGESIRFEQVPVYQWTLRSNGEKDFAQALFNLLSKEERDTL